MIEKRNYRSQDISAKTGVYIFRDYSQNIIYVGKAKNLRKRLQSYLSPSALLRNNIKNRNLIKQIFSFETIETRSEKNALILEDQLVKDYQPKYNVLLRDDKRFLLIRLDYDAPFPYPELVRFKRRDKCLYFGPFPNGFALKETLDYLVKFFALRSCTSFIPSKKDKLHCHNHIIRFCSSPCDQSISQVEYKEKVTRFREALEGKNKGVLTELEEKMKKYAGSMNYEKALEIRDMLNNVKFLFFNRTYLSNKQIHQPSKSIIKKIKEELVLKNSPKIIECFDISHFQGSYLVASMVQFLNGKPNKNSYRRFKIKYVKENNDFQSIFEVLTRRYHRLKNENKPLPNLILVDGGKGQLTYAQKALKLLNIYEKVDLFSLAKKEEILYSHQFLQGLKLKETNNVHKLMRFIRDESHRFALSFHQSLRNKKITNSLLDEIPSIGEKRSNALLKAFSSVNNIRRQSIDTIVKKVPLIGYKQAKVILEFLNQKLV